ncbi:hypothetical protein [Paenibacillus alkalitolerans]|uniref:hypothetical protein n=1 Tax=Paenibacillus alkalitolerans TaxID=2799335 RepID=UPI0018F6EDBF|nr:hypothetical protein [Paenibacillus alkalitolerans]
MEREKRTIIVTEIEHWRRSKLLPEQYCDFLLNLYAESADIDVKPDRHCGKQAVLESNALQWVSLFGIVACICYVALHFSSFRPQLQIGLFVFGCVAPYVSAALIRRRKPLAANVSSGLGTALMLIAGPLLLRQMGWQEWVQTALYFSVCSLIWLGAGVGFRMSWLHFCGWLGLIVSYALVLNRLSVPGDWVTLELCWLPLSFLLGWLGWLFSRRAKNAGAVLLVVSCLLWFMPESYALLLTDWSVTAAQMLLLGKLALLGALAFMLRKIWIEWVV